MLVHGDTAAIILNSNRVIFVDGYFNMCAVTSHSLVDGVVNGLIYKMVETFLRNVTDIHGWTFTHSFQTFEDLNVTRGIIVYVVLIFCHFGFLQLIVCKVTKNLAKYVVFSC